MKIKIDLYSVKAWRISLSLSNNEFLILKVYGGIIQYRYYVKSESSYLSTPVSGSDCFCH